MPKDSWKASSLSTSRAIRRGMSPHLAAQRKAEKKGKTRQVRRLAAHIDCGNFIVTLVKAGKKHAELEAILASRFPEKIWRPILESRRQVWLNRHRSAPTQPSPTGSESATLESPPWDETPTAAPPAADPPRHSSAPSAKAMCSG